MRSRAGMARKAGSRSRRRVHRLRRRCARRRAPGLLAPYQPPRHSRATGAASGTPSFSQSSSATKRRGARAGGVEPREGAELRRRCRRDRARRTASGWHPPAAPRSPPAAAPAPAAGRPTARAAGLAPRPVKSQGVASRPSAAHPVRPAQRRGQRQQPAHAIADQHHGPRQRRPSARSSRPGDIVGQGEAALGLARPAPVEQQRPHPLPGEEAQHGGPGSQVQHLGAVDQGGDEQHQRRRAPPAGR